MADGKVHTLATPDFEKAFGDELSERVAKKIDEYSLKYTELTEEERDESLLVIIRALLDPNLGKSGGHRAHEWEEGWSENLEDLDKGVDPVEALTPRYMSPKNEIRNGVREIIILL